MNEDAWERYDRGEPTKLTLSIAAPQNLENLPGVAGSVLGASKRLAEITEAPVVTLQVSMGRARGSLSKQAVDAVLRAFTTEEQEENVRSLSVKSRVEGLPSDEIDFIKDLARDQAVLDLPSDNHDGHLQIRYAFIERSFEARLAYLRERYG